MEPNRAHLEALAAAPALLRLDRAMPAHGCDDATLDRMARDVIELALEDGRTWSQTARANRIIAAQAVADTVGALAHDIAHDTARDIWTGAICARRMLSGQHVTR